MKIKVSENEQAMSVKIGRISMLYSNDMAYKELDDKLEGLVVLQ